MCVFRISTIENEMSPEKLEYNQLMDDAYMYLLNGSVFKPCLCFKKQCMAISELLFCWQMSRIYLLLFSLVILEVSIGIWYIYYINVSMYVYVRMHSRVACLAVRPYGLCLNFPYTHFLLSDYLPCVFLLSSLFRRLIRIASYKANCFDKSHFSSADNQYFIIVMSDGITKLI